MSNVVRLNLTRPPDRAAAGMPAGSPYVSYQRDDLAQFPVEIGLPGGIDLTVEAGLLTLDSFGQPEPETAPPTALDLHTYPPTLEDGRDLLLAAAARFGLDATAIDSWYEEARAARDGAVRSGWLRATVDYLRLEVRGSHKPPVDDPDSAQTAVHYVLTW